MVSLGIDIPVAIANTTAAISDAHYSLHFAKSQHKQVAIWPMVEHSFFRSRLVTQSVHQLRESKRELILERAQKAIGDQGWFGTGLIRFDLTGEIIDVVQGVRRESMWTLDFSLTSQFENEVRAVMDLPLGDVRGQTQSWLTMEFEAPSHLDMVHPYLHLCARNPRLKFHHYDSHRGVISLSQEEGVRGELEHAVEYMEGIIEE